MRTSGEDARPLEGASNLGDPRHRVGMVISAKYRDKRGLSCASNLKRSRQCSGKDPVPASRTGLNGDA